MAEKTGCCISIGADAGVVDEEMSPSDADIDCVTVADNEMASTNFDDSCEQAAKNAVCSSEYAPNQAKRTCYDSVVAASKEVLAIETNGSGNMFSPFEEVYTPNIPSQTVIKIEDTETHLQSRKKQPCTVKERVCQICSQQSRTNLYVCRHVNVHFKSVTYICDICTSTFRDENIFINHSKQHNGDRPFYCYFCNTWFCDLADLNSHTNEFQHRDFIHCSICGKRSARKFKIKVIKNSGSFPMVAKCRNRKLVYCSEYICEQCHPRNTYDCEICGRMFHRPTSLSTHYDRCHRSGGPFKCKECFASYTKRCMLEHHLEIHPGRQKPWVCHLCGVRFAVQSYYLAHLQNHKALKPFSCDNCGKNFCFEGELKSHLDEHEAHALDCLSESLTPRCSSTDEEMSTLSTEKYDSVNGMSTLAAHNVETSHDSSNDCVQIANISDKSIGINIFEGSETVLPKNENYSTIPEYNKSFSLDDVKQEVLSDDEEAYVTIKEHGSAYETVQSCLFENRYTSVDWISENGMDTNFASQKQFSGSVSLKSPTAAMFCNEDNHRQNNNSGISPSGVKVEVVAEEKCVTSERTVVDVEKQKIVQQTNERNLCLDSVKEEVILNEESVDEAIVKNGVKEEASSEFCPLDFVSTELTLCKNETPTTDNTFFPGVSGEIVTAIGCTSLKEPCLTSEALLKTEWDETVPSEELNIPVDIKEEISNSPSVNNYIKKEVNCSPCQDVGDLDKDGWSMPEQQSDIVIDSKLPSHFENKHGSDNPLSSWSHIKLETDHRSTEDKSIKNYRSFELRGSLVITTASSSSSSSSEYLSKLHNRPKWWTEKPNHQGPISQCLHDL